MEIKRVKVHPVKCPRCRLTVMVKPDDKVCPVCQNWLPTDYSVFKETLPG